MYGVCESHIQSFFSHFQTIDLRIMRFLIGGHHASPLVPPVTLGGVGGLGAKFGRQNGEDAVTSCAFLDWNWNVLQKQTAFNLSAVFINM